MLRSSRGRVNPLRNNAATEKIPSVGASQFSLDVLKDKCVNSIQFLVDDKTKVEGKLAVGAQATVEFRADGSKNIAVRVIVTSASGMNLSWRGMASIL